MPPTLNGFYLQARFALLPGIFQLSRLDCPSSCASCLLRALGEMLLLQDSPWLDGILIAEMIFRVPGEGVYSYFEPFSTPNAKSPSDSRPEESSSGLAQTI